MHLTICRFIAVCASSLYQLFHEDEKQLGAIAWSSACKVHAGCKSCFKANLAGQIAFGTTSWWSCQLGKSCHDGAGPMHCVCLQACDTLFYECAGVRVGADQVDVALVAGYVKGLQCLHRLGWVHGDVEPRHLCINPTNGCPVIIGLSKARKRKQAPKPLGGLA